MRGFALLEIIVAIVISGLLFTQVHLSFGTIMRSFRHYADSVQRLPLMQDVIEHVLVDRARGKKIEPFSRYINDSNTTLTLTITEPTNASALGKFPNLRIVTVQAQWPDRQTRFPMQLRRYIYLSEKES